MITYALRLLLAIIPAVLWLSAGASALPLGPDSVTLATQQSAPASAAGSLDRAAGILIPVAQKCRRGEVWQCTKTTREMRAIGWPATYCSCNSAQDDAPVRPRSSCKSEPGCPCVNGRQVCH